jgi:hypothetical protein
MNKLLISMIIASSVFLVGKEFLPMSYEIIVITGCVVIFLFLKKNLTPSILEYFNQSRLAMVARTENLITNQITLLTPTFSQSLLEHEAKNIFLPENVEQNINLLANNAEILLTNTINQKFNSLIANLCVLEEINMDSKYSK